MGVGLLLRRLLALHLSRFFRIPLGPHSVVGESFVSGSDARRIKFCAELRNPHHVSAGHHLAEDAPQRHRVIPPGFRFQAQPGRGFKLPSAAGDLKWIPPDSLASSCAFSCQSTRLRPAVCCSAEGGQAICASRHHLWRPAAYEQRSLEGFVYLCLRC